MPLRNAKAVRYSPVGVCDALAGEDAFPGSMSALQNLIPDPTTRNLWVPRPAAIKLATVSAGVISASLLVGSYVYGMAASTTYPGFDEPFCYNIISNTIVPITGIVSGSLPRSLNTVGDWTPPSMALIGVQVTVAHAGFQATGRAVGWINITTPAAPVWTSGNTAGFALPYPPSWVAQFNQRAYYGVNIPNGQPAAVASNSLDPTTCTNSTYVLTFGDNVPLTAGAGLPLSNALGGIFQALMVFKGASNIYQVTGDFTSTSSPITVNSLNVATGTLAPNSICETPLGISFISPEGLRLINFSAQVSDPIGEPNEQQKAGVVAPFINAVYPTRIAAACNAKVIRISTQNGQLVGSPNQEYWYDLARKVWSGPHSFPAALIDAYQDTFIMSPVGVAGSLWRSDPTTLFTSTYLENGVALSWLFATTYLPPRGDAHQCVMNETMIYAGLAVGQGFNVTLTDENNNVLATYAVPALGGATLWDYFDWDDAVWDGDTAALGARNLLWTQPIEFDRMMLTATGVSATGAQMGDIYLRYQPLGYSSQP